MPNFVDAVIFSKDLGGISDQFDRTAAYKRINAPARQFVKWDCSGNAAIGGMTSCAGSTLNMPVCATGPKTSLG